MVNLDRGSRVYGGRDADVCRHTGKGILKWSFKLSEVLPCVHPGHRERIYSTLYSYGPNIELIICLLSFFVETPITCVKVEILSCGSNFSKGLGEESHVQDLVRSLCCVLVLYTSLLQCLSPPRSVNGYQRTFSKSSGTAAC